MKNWFNTRKKKIVLECITDSALAYNYAPVQKASKFLPQWWIDLAKKPLEIPQDLSHNMDMRGCIGMRDIYSRGLMIPMWTDVRVSLGPEGTNLYRYQFADRKSQAMEHPEPQRGAYLPNLKYQHLKLISPWLFQCSEDVGFYFCQSTWNMNSVNEYTVFPGVVDYKHQFTTNVNIMFHRTKEARIIEIPIGQPLAHVVPLDDRPLEIKLVLDEDRYKRLESQSQVISFFNSQKKKRAIDNRQQSKCPFGFGDGT